MDPNVDSSHTVRERRIEYIEYSVWPYGPPARPHPHSGNLTRRGDVLVMTKLDRLGRSVREDTNAIRRFPLPPKRLKELVEETVDHHASPTHPTLQETTIRWRGGAPVWLCPAPGYALRRAAGSMGIETPSSFAGMRGKPNGRGSDRP